MIQEIVTSRSSSDRQLVGREIELLKDLYQKIWCEAFYDFDTPESQAWARKIYPLIKELNELIGFSK